METTINRLPARPHCPLPGVAITIKATILAGYAAVMQHQRVSRRHFLLVIDAASGAGGRGYVFKDGEEKEIRTNWRDCTARPDQ